MRSSQLREYGSPTIIQSPLLIRLWMRHGRLCALFFFLLLVCLHPYSHLPTFFSGFAKVRASYPSPLEWLSSLELCLGWWMDSLFFFSFFKTRTHWEMGTKVGRCAVNASCSKPTVSQCYTSTVLMCVDCWSTRTQLMQAGSIIKILNPFSYSTRVEIELGFPFSLGRRASSWKERLKVLPWQRKSQDRVASNPTCCAQPVYL